MLLTGPLRRLSTVFFAGLAPLIVGPPVRPDFAPVIDGTVCRLSWCEQPADEYRDGKALCHAHVDQYPGLQFLADNPDWRTTS